MFDQTNRRPELWGGVECSIVRIGDTYRDETEETGHRHAPGDLDAVAALGLRTLRYPVLWETVSPIDPDTADWSFPDAQLGRLRELGITPIAGLIHHGSGPRYTSLMDENFAALFAAHAENVARRYPWLRMFTPVNEPLTTARFSGLYGHWYPHRQDMGSFLRCLFNQCMATLLAMRAIRRIIPEAQLVQTEDLGKVFSTPHLAYQAQHENERRWLSLDLLCGRLDRSHPWHATFLRHGIHETELATFLGGEAQPDIIGINYYATSERYLDEALHLYPACFHGGNPREPYADVEAVRVDLPAESLGARARLSEAWERYRLPLAITEVHHGSTREEQLRWVAEVWQDACGLAAAGADIRAVTAWSLLGAVDWNSLLTERRGFYEPGAFDVRGARPRPTAIGKAIAQLAAGREIGHPVLDRYGWWRREGRFHHAPAGRAPALLKHPRAILIAGASGRLGREILRQCDLRGLDAVCPPRSELDITDPAAVGHAIARHRPWAVINAAGAGHGGPAAAPQLIRLDGHGAENLARACSRHAIPLMTFSADRVFDGVLERPYVEGDRTAPACALGGSKARTERLVTLAHAGALIIRTSALFSPEDDRLRLGELRGASLGGRSFLAATYTPDLVRAALDLLIDGETGIWHLANQGAVPVSRYAGLFGLAEDALSTARRLVVLASERGRLMPSLAEALERHRDLLASRAPVAGYAVTAE